MAAIFKIQYANVRAKAKVEDRHPGQHGGRCPSCGGRTIRSRTTKIINRYCWDCRYLRMIYGTSITIERIK